MLHLLGQLSLQDSTTLLNYLDCLIILKFPFLRHHFLHKLGIIWHLFQSIDKRNIDVYFIKNLKKLEELGVKLLLLKPLWKGQWG